MKPKQTIEWGYPPKTYHFTGKYHKRTIGYYKAFQNKETVYAPIYKSDDGETFNDMSQMIFKREVNKIDKRQRIFRRRN